MMWKDPFVEELHALRAEMTQALGGNMHRYAEHLRRSQQQRFAANAGNSPNIADETLWNSIVGDACV
jgi:hypothetical protein